MKKQFLLLLLLLAFFMPTISGLYIHNNYSEKIYWQIFKKRKNGQYNSTALKKGTIESGKKTYWKAKQDFLMIQFRKNSYKGEKVVPATFFFTQFDVYLTAEGKFNQPCLNWMSHPKILNKTLYQLTLPGTHDAGAYSFIKPFQISPDGTGGNLTVRRVSRGLEVTWIVPQVGALVKTIKDAAIKEYAKTQSVSVGEQLRSGIRVLDLRVVKHKGHFRTAHAVVGKKITDIFGEIQNFLDATAHEIVILKLGIGTTTDGSQLSSSVIDNNRAELIDKTSMLSSKQITLADLDRPVGDLTSDGSKILITINRSSNFPDFINNPDLFLGRSVDVNNKKDLYENYKTFFEGLDGNSEKKLSTMSWSIESFKKWKTPKQWSNIINPSLGTLLSLLNGLPEMKVGNNVIPAIPAIVRGNITVNSGSIIPNIVNVIMIDFFENNSKVVQRAISLSKK